MIPHRHLQKNLPSVAFLIALMTSGLAWGAQYSVISERCQNLETRQTVAAIREIASGSKAMKLVIDPATLETALVSAKKLSCERTTLTTDPNFVNASYGRLLTHFAKPASGKFVAANEGFKRFAASCAVRAADASTSLAPMVLTMDLCPAHSEGDAKHPHRPFDLGYFQSLQQEGLRTGRVVNATVFVSGGWLRMHKRETKQLLELNDPSKGLSLTFANHSNTHPYLGNHIPSTQNFMTALSRDQFFDEVVATEKEMLKAGITPSVFFRFPGLMSNANEITALQEMGLVPVGTTGWLALNGGSNPQYAGFDFSNDQAAKPGRILLTHANGNEENGVRGRRGILDFLSANGAQTTFVSIATAAACAVP